MSNKPLVDLFVRVSPSDPHLKGACIISQKWFMIYYLLVERNYIDLRITPISPHVPPPGYSKLKVGRHLPVVAVTMFDKDYYFSASGDITVDYGRPLDRTPSMIAETEEERDRLLKHWNIPGFDPDLENTTITSQLVQKLKLFLLDGKVHKILDYLHKLDTYLEQLGTSFLGGNEPNYDDCTLAPKLQHFRIATAYYRGFQIPDELSHVWTYMANIYSLSAFQNSCPSDRDILLHYLDRVVNGSLQDMAAHKTRLLLLPKEMCLSTVPANVKPTFMETDNNTNPSNPVNQQYQTPKNNSTDDAKYWENKQSDGSENSYNGTDASSDDMTKPVCVNSIEYNWSNIQNSSLIRYHSKRVSENYSPLNLHDELTKLKPWLHINTLYRETPPPVCKSQIYTRLINQP